MVWTINQRGQFALWWDDQEDLTNIDEDITSAPDVIGYVSNVKAFPKFNPEGGSKASKKKVIKNVMSIAVISKDDDEEEECHYVYYDNFIDRLWGNQDRSSAMSQYIMGAHMLTPFWVQE